MRFSSCRNCCTEDPKRGETFPQPEPEASLSGFVKPI